MKNKIKVLLGPSSFGALDQAPLTLLKKNGFDIVDNPFKRRLKKEEVVDLLREDIHGLIAGLEPLDREVMEHSSLKVISRCGAGMSNVDMDAAKDLNILVYSTPNGPTESVAELTLGALLGLLRDIPLMNTDLHQGQWTKRIGSQLQGKTLAIIGYGRIGRRVAELVQPFNVSLLAVDPALSQGDVDIPLWSLAEALPKADIVSLHCSGETCVLGRDQLMSMKQGAVLLNASRGSLVDESALCDVLSSGHLSGVWMDAFQDEPYAGPLLSFPQAILTPHVGSYTREGRLNMEMETVKNLIKGFNQIQ